MLLCRETKGRKGGRKQGEMKVEKKRANLRATTVGPPVFRAAAPFIETTRHRRTPPYSPTGKFAGALENRVVPVWARPLEPF
ncbi:hypothetical protein SV7mr_34960 [Stieleria bergensis]|uniref:Uncharacterized protein n=1 Tax=Stieleria bergensis TaxID=2528025 RepID=A0A517SXT6_9BACT|nr:hypothetical protein SV7mr_34960 [Planctomycetes bacterium SV_7m_r]